MHRLEKPSAKSGTGEKVREKNHAQAFVNAFAST
jgi:hypothetical protein